MSFTFFFFINSWHYFLCLEQVLLYSIPPTLLCPASHLSYRFLCLSLFFTTLTKTTTTSSSLQIQRRHWAVLSNRCGKVLRQKKNQFWTFNSTTYKNKTKKLLLQAYKFKGDTEPTYQIDVVRCWDTQKKIKKKKQSWTFNSTRNKRNQNNNNNKK